MPRDFLRELRIEQLSISDLHSDPLNPRKHSSQQVRQIAKSIDKFGFNVPILVDVANLILAGHGRVLGARALGWKAVPAIRIAHLTAPQARAFAIADNRLTENSSWDDRLLGDIFRELSALELDFSLDVTGFSIAEIDLRINEASEPNAQPDRADEIPEAPTGSPVTILGDLWILGKHQVFCGDSTNASSYDVVMAGSRAEVIFVDPPYNVPINGHATGKGRIHHREFAMAGSEMTSGQYTHFLTIIFYLLVRNSVPGSLHYVCMDWRHQLELLNAGNQAYTEHKNTCIWIKDLPGMGSLYRSQHELVFVFKNGKSRHRNNVQLGQYGRNRTNVWNYPSVSAFARKSEEGSLLALHPTVKPVALVADAILDCSAPGDIVLDSFLGSGTTLIAAERTRRVCRAIEIDPLYVDTAIRRWQRHCGEKAIHAITGKSFEAHAAERVEAHHG